MNKTELLEFVSQLLDEQGIPYDRSDILDNPALVVTPEESEFTPEDCTILAEELEFECTGLHFIVLVQTGMDEKTCHELQKVIPELCRHMRIGSFFVMPEDGTLMYNYCFIADDMEKEELKKSIIASFNIVISVSAEGKYRLMPLISGEKDAGELLQDDISIPV